MIDLWTLWHFLGWLIVALVLARWTRWYVWEIVVWGALVGVGWEFIEWNWVEGWLGFAEPWNNRGFDVVVDVLGATTGALVGRGWRDRW